MDADRYQDTISNFRDAIGFVGKRYLVVPVDLGAYQSFHPKLILLLGTDRARLILGSGNLTFNGYGDNLEVFTLYDWSEKQPQSLALFSYVWNLITSTQDKWGYSDQASRMLEKAEYQSPWLQEISETPSKPFISSLDSPLIEGIQNILSGKKVKNITIFSPFLDEQAQGIQSLYRNFNPLEVNLILQPNYSLANPESIQKLIDEEIPLKLFQAIEQDRYIHAKIYLFETEDNVVAFTGSANCTKAGLLSGTETGNYELLTHREFSNSKDAIRFLEFGIRYKVVTDLDTLNLKRSSTLEITPPPSIRLLDVAIDGSYLLVKFVIKKLPKSIGGIHLKSDFPKTINIPIGEFSIGSNEHKILLSDEVLTLTHGIFSVYMQGISKTGKDINLYSNSLWVTNQTELNKRVTFLTPDDEASARLLREKLLNDDQKWTSLYKTLVDLVELDVGQIRKVSPSTKKRKSPRDKEEAIEKESTLLVINEIAERENRLAEIEADINRESRIHSWLEIVLGMFPQDRFASPHPKTTGGTKTASKKPSKDIGKRFIKLIRRYIRVIQNEEFTQSLPSYYLLAYFSIFQRITWILYSSGVVSKEDYLDYSLGIFHSYFGSISDKSTPFFLPTIQNHLRWRYETQWRESQAHLHAITNIHVLQDIFSYDENIIEKLNIYFTHLLSCLICIIPPEKILSDLDNIDPLANFYNYDAVELNDALSKSIKDNSPSIINILNEWILDSEISLFRDAGIDNPDILFSARVSLGIGDQRVKEYLNKVEETQSWLCLIQWCCTMDESNQGSNFLQKLVGVFRYHGFSSQLSKALYELAKSAKQAERYEDSLELIDQALLITEEDEDSSFIKSVLVYKKMVKYLSSMKV